MAVVRRVSSCAGKPCHHVNWPDACQRECRYTHRLQAAAGLPPTPPPVDEGSRLSNQTFVPVAVVTPRQDDAEAISQTLRNGGCAARCEWVEELGDLAGVMETQTPELIFYFVRADLTDELPHVADIRDRIATETPLIVVYEHSSEEAIAEAMTLGAQDLVSLASRVRLQAVGLRELHHCRQTRGLMSMQKSTHKLEEQLNSMVEESAEALMLVQEGIIVNVNPAWLKLLGFSDRDDVIGTPALDVFADEAHTAIKGAMVACAADNWGGHTLEAKGVGSDGSEIAVKVEFEAAQFDDEACVRVDFSLDERRIEQTPREIVASTERHPLTGFFRRQRFLQEMEKKLEEPSRGGMWLLAYIKPDGIANLREQIGPLSSDDLLLDFARILQDHARNNDVYGQFGGDLFMVLMPRGTARDAYAWAENLRKSVAAHVFEADDKSLSITCTIGLARFLDDTKDLSDLIIKAQKSYQNGLKDGGNCTHLPQLTDEEEGHRQGDTEYVRKIKASLMTDGFRLVFQPVANLGTQSQQMFDVLLRMLDSNREVMPGVFLPPAKRNGLMKNIDRWVIANALRFCADQRPQGLFIRLSADSIPDKTLVPWIASLISSTGVEPRSLIFQVTETDAEDRLRDVKELGAGLKGLHCQIAVEHFGVSQHPLQILEHVPLDFLKIDGSLMEGIAIDKAKQKTVRRYISAANERRIATVAERVEDANTMAVLWQLGVEYIQGFYVQGPEEIVLESA